LPKHGDQHPIFGGQFAPPDLLDDFFLGDQVLLNLGFLVAAWRDDAQTYCDRGERCGWQAAATVHNKRGLGKQAGAIEQASARDVSKSPEIEH
jgi:hypothetical protein